MAASLLALLDDIASILDDVSILTKVAAKKTTGVLGDDLALNAQQVTGVNADRELPVVWAVFKGSALNKAILVPAALAISAFVPWAVTPLLMMGGLYLCFEGVEKLAHGFMHRRQSTMARPEHEREQQARVEANTQGSDPPLDASAAEKEKIKGAVRTDFILSAEIIAITLGTVQHRALLTQLTVMIVIAAVMTVGVYGIVAAIVKLDDAGLYLSRVEGDGAPARIERAVGRAILAAAPWLMKALSIVGTVAMFLVGGGILSHGIPVLQHGIEAVAQASASLGGTFLAAVTPLVLEALAGVLAGTAALLLWTLAQRLRPRRGSAGLR